MDHASIAREPQAGANRQRIPLHGGVTALERAYDLAWAWCRNPAEHLLDGTHRSRHGPDTELDQRHEPPVRAPPFVSVRMTGMTQQERLDSRTLRGRRWIE